MSNALIAQTGYVLAINGAAPTVTAGPLTAPGAPTNVTAVAGNAAAIVSFSAPASNGGSPITGYIVTGTPTGSQTGAGSPITVSGLTNGTSYTFQVIAVNSIGTGPASSASNAVTPASSGGGNLVQVFDYLSAGFPTASHSAINLITGASQAFSGTVLQLDNGATGTHEAGAVWYNVSQIDVSAGFTTHFRVQLAAIPYDVSERTEVNSTAGITFSVQNSTTTTNPLNEYGVYAGDHIAADSNMCGFGAYTGQYPIGNSVCIKFDVGASSASVCSYPAAPGGQPSATGMFINGGPYASPNPQEDLNPYGVNLNLGNVMDVFMVYDGSLLTMTITDMTTNASARFSWPVNIPNVLGQNAGWFGFTSGELPANVQAINGWQLWTGFATRLATPTFSVVSGQYTGTQNVLISAPSGSTVYYTTNGLQPTTKSSVYGGAITISSSSVVQAVAIQSGYTDSLVATANYQIASLGTPRINFSSGFSGASGLVIPCGSAVLGSMLSLTDTLAGNGITGTNTATGEVGSAWFAAPININSFTSTFTIKQKVSSGGGGYGLSFVVQNQPPASYYTSGGNANQATGGGGPFAINGVPGSDFPSCGYSGNTGSPTTNPGGGQLTGLQSSAAVCFIGSANTIGFVLNGAAANTNASSPSPVSLGNGNAQQVTVTYSGTTLTVAIVDSTAGTSYSKAYTNVNLAAAVGASTAYVGFAAAGSYVVVSQVVSNWTVN